MSISIDPTTGRIVIDNPVENKSPSTISDISIPKSMVGPMLATRVDAPSMSIATPSMSIDRSIMHLDETTIAPTLGNMNDMRPDDRLPYRTFSGCDINCIVHVVGNDGVTEPVVIANAQTLSYSIHREKFPVRTLGRTYAAGFTRGCIGSGTPIHTSNGLRCIEDIEIGDMILSYNTSTSTNEYKRCVGKVFTGYKECIKISIDGGEYAYLTSDHKVYYNNEWIESKLLNVGDKLLTSKDGYSTILCMDTSSILHPTWDIEVEDNHNIYGPFLYSNSRTISGTIIFTMFDREVLWELIQAYRMDVEYVNGDNVSSLRSPLLDQLPPFDITIEFSNEYGHHAFMAIYGVELHDEGTVLSVDDMIVEKTMQYTARDIDILRPQELGSLVGGVDPLSRSISANHDDYGKFVEYLQERRMMIDGASTDDVWGYDIPYDGALFLDSKNSSVGNYKSGDYVIYAPGRIDTTGNSMQWYGTVKNMKDGVITFIPSDGAYEEDTSKVYYIYDSYTRMYSNRDASKIPPHLLFHKVRDSEVHPSYLYKVGGRDFNDQDVKNYG